MKSNLGSCVKRLRVNLIILVKLTRGLWRRHAFSIFFIPIGGVHPCSTRTYSIARKKNLELQHGYNNFHLPSPDCHWLYCTVVAGVWVCEAHFCFQTTICAPIGSKTIFQLKTWTNMHVLSSAAVAAGGKKSHQNYAERWRLLLSSYHMGRCGFPCHSEKGGPIL